MLNLDELLVSSATDFGGAALALRAEIGRWGHDQLRSELDRLLCAGRFDDAASIIYLLAEHMPADETVAIAEHIRRHAPESTSVQLALADLRHRHGHLAEALALCGTPSAETADERLIIKYCDFARDLGRSFLGEALLRSGLRLGRETLLARLAEHFREGRDWLSLRDLLNARPQELLSDELLYFLGRAQIGLLQESAVSACADILWKRDAPGPRYAQLLHDVWRWRIGDVETSPILCDATGLPPLISADAVAIAQAPERFFPDETVVRSLTGWRALRPRENLPNVLGIGVQRAATTWLWHQLCRQPEVQPLPLKECVFFSDVFGSPRDLDPSLPDVDPDEDLSYWDGPTRNLFRYLRLYGAGFPVRADFSPSYAELPPETISVLRDMLGPDVKIILSLRDPVARCWSNLLYDLNLSGGDLRALSFADRAAHYTSAASFRRCDYAGILDRWSRHFTDIKVIFFEDVANRPRELLADIRHFLELSQPPGADGGTTKARVNASIEAAIPETDRMFLLGLHRRHFDESEAMFGARATAWRAGHERGSPTQRSSSDQA